MNSRKVFCATLGCDKNLVDSEALLGRFIQSGVGVVADPEDADIWVLNSCGFIDAARRDSEETLCDLIENKGERTLVVCGCWSQEHGRDIRRRFPEVDIVAGVGQADKVVEACLGRSQTEPDTERAGVSSSGDNPFALAGPPFRPPSLPSDTACGFFFGSVLDCLAIPKLSQIYSQMRSENSISLFSDCLSLLFQLYTFYGLSIRQ